MDGLFSKTRGGFFHENMEAKAEKKGSKESKQGHMTEGH